MTTDQPAVVELLPCPFCEQPLRVKDGINPTAQCDTDACWMEVSRIAIPIDYAPAIRSWNTRAHSARPDVGEVQAQALRAALKEIVHLRPPGDVERCAGSRKLVEKMETIALLALSKDQYLSAAMGEVGLG